MGESRFEYAFEFAEKIETIVGNVWLPRSEIDHGSGFSGLIETSISTFKGTVSRDFRPLVFFVKQSHLGNCLTQYLLNKINTRRLTNETILTSAMRLSAKQKFAIELISKFETEFENILRY
jgi:hypothetical protein